MERFDGSEGERWWSDRVASYGTTARAALCCRILLLKAT